MSNLLRGSSYYLNNKWYEVEWSGEKYSYCSSYDDKRGCFEKGLLKNSKLLEGEYCPF